MAYQTADNRNKPKNTKIVVKDKVKKTNDKHNYKVKTRSQPIIPSDKENKNTKH